RGRTVACGSSSPLLSTAARRYLRRAGPLIGTPCQPIIRRVIEKQDISLAICGHAWHGKSTLLGKIVAETGMASPRELEHAQRLAADGRDASLVFAQLVFRSKDVTQEHSEAARGVTILPSMVRFEYPDHRITVI